jgi:hypothetical protein
MPTTFDKKIDQLPQATLPLSGNELITVIQGGVSKQVAVSAIGGTSLTQAATPTFSPLAGIYNAAQLVAIASATPGALIYYTVNGSTPTTSSTLYIVPLAVNGTQTLKAIATAPGFSTSAVGSATYTININPMGVNLPAGGAASLAYEGFPLFQDRFRESRYVCNFTGSIAATGVLTVTATAFNSIPLGGRITGGGIAQNTYIAQQLSGVTGGTGTYQLNITGTTVASETMSYFQPVDAAGWPTSDFQTILYEGQRTNLAWIIAGTAKFACGFTTRAAGTETITGQGATISNRVYNAGTGVVSFDLLVTGGNFGYSVTGTTGGVTNQFAYLPAYRASAYSAASLFTAEALAHHNQYSSMRSMWPQNPWYNAGYQLPFTTTVAIGATSATLILPFPFATGTYIYILMCAVGSTPDVRSITMTNGSTAVSWTGATTIAANGMHHPNTSQTRRTPANTKCYQSWQAQGLDKEAFPAEWWVDFAIQCNNIAYLCGPTNDDGTWYSSVGTMLASKYALYPNLKAWVEPGNENWNGGYSRGAPAALTALAAFNGLTIANQLATLVRSMATNLKAGAGTTFFNNQIAIVMAWQAGNFGTLFNALAYYKAQAWSIPGDMKFLAVAPYFKRLTAANACTASLASTGILTVTAAPFPNIVVGATVTGAGVPIGTIITAQLTGTPFGLGTYQTTPGGTTIASEAMTTSLDVTSSISQINAYMMNAGNYAASNSQLDGLAALAGANGLQAITYEDGWDTGFENVGMVNAGATIMDNSHVAPMNNYYAGHYNHGIVQTAHFTSGVFDTTVDNLSPSDELSTIYPITVANSPRFASLASFFPGKPAPTFNVVNGSGSIIPGTNFCDNTANNGGYSTVPKGNFAGGSGVAPRYATGYVTYLINCTLAGTYALLVTFSGCAASPVTDVEVGGTVLSTGTAVSNAAVALGNVPLVLGVNYVTLGHNGSQTATVEQLQFN